MFKEKLKSWNISRRKSITETRMHDRNLLKEESDFSIKEMSIFKERATGFVWNRVLVEA